MKNDLVGLNTTAMVLITKMCSLISGWGALKASLFTPFHLSLILKH